MFPRDVADNGIEIIDIAFSRVELMKAWRIAPVRVADDTCINSYPSSTYFPAERQ